MNEYIGMIKLFAGNFAPKYWAFCDGSLQSIANNSALFSILGTQYGGDGRTTFALPDMRSRVQAGPGRIGGNDNLYQGELLGSESVTLVEGQIPQHTHYLLALNANGNTPNPSGALLANQIEISGRDTTVINGYSNAFFNSSLSHMTLKTTGNSTPHENRQPYLALNYIICMYGVYPSRS